MKWMHHGGGWRLALLAAALLTAGCQVRPETSAVAQDDPANPPFVLTPAQRQSAIDQIVAAANSPDAYMRGLAVEAAQYLPDRATPLLQLALNDEQESVRFAALVMVGRLKLTALRPQVRQAQADASIPVRLASIYALHQLGENVDVNPFAKVMSNPSPQVRGNAALLLGLMGEPSAIPMLRDMSRMSFPRSPTSAEAVVRLQITESLIRLGDDQALNAMRAGMYSQLDEVRIMATQMVGKLGDRNSENALGGFIANAPVDLQVAAATSLAQIGRPEAGMKVVHYAAGLPEESLRAQAAGALGYFHDDLSARLRVRLLGDASPLVRLMAAKSIVQAAADPRAMPDREPSGGTSGGSSGDTSGGDGGDEPPIDL